MWTRHGRTVMEEERVVLVDKQDSEVGTEEKMRAHREGGKLHRAFSVLIFNSKKELLVQKRAESKYHCPGIWANTACSHPRPQEDIVTAGRRRLRFEMGLDTELEDKFSFVYRVDFDNGLTEWEYDHVLVGFSDDDPEPNADEVSEFKWMNVQDVRMDMVERPERYSIWFRKIMALLKDEHY